jgi:antitoxin ChpS
MPCNKSIAALVFYSSKTSLGTLMACAATLRQSGGSVILSIPKSIAEAMSVKAGSIVELVLEGQKLSVVPSRQGLAERLARSPPSPDLWARDDDWLNDAPAGAELL